MALETQFIPGAPPPLSRTTLSVLLLRAVGRAYGYLDVTRLSSRRRALRTGYHRTRASGGFYGMHVSPAFLCEGYLWLTVVLLESVWLHVAASCDVLSHLSQRQLDPQDDGIFNVFYLP